MIKRRLLIALAIILVIGILRGSYFTFSCYSEGSRAGSVIKFSHKGVIFKTWEGEMMQRTVSLPTQDTWHFSCKDDSISQQINDAMSHGNKVDLHYCEKFYSFFWQGETQYFIDRVTVIKD